MMSNAALKLSSPTSWIQTMFDEIDTLRFGDGFDHLTEQTEMQFGTAQLRGVEAIKAFFVKIDTPLDITHRICEFWDSDSVKILRGEAELRKKNSDAEFITTPFMHIFYMDDDGGKVKRWFIVNGPIKTDAVI